MNAPKLRVSSIPWREPVSRQSIVEFVGPSGRRFRCFSDGYEFIPGEELSAIRFGYLARTTGDNDAFKGNPEKEKVVEMVGEWDAEVAGQIVSLDRDTAMIDAGDLMLPVTHLTRDPASVGSWVRLQVSRLEVERA
jgi:hypothetical protein